MSGEWRPKGKAGKAWQWSGPVTGLLIGHSQADLGGL